MPTPSPLALRILRLHDAARPHLRPRDAVQLALLASGAHPNSALSLLLRGQFPILPADTALVFSRDFLTLHASLLESLTPFLDPPDLSSPLAKDAVQDGALTSLHLLLSAWRQVPLKTGAPLLPSRFLLHLAGGDSQLARALHGAGLSLLPSFFDEDEPSPLSSASPAPMVGVPETLPLLAAARWMLPDPRTPA